MPITCPSMECKIMVPIRDHTTNAYEEDDMDAYGFAYLVGPGGTITTIGRPAGHTGIHEFYMSTLADPELQDWSNDLVIGPAETVVVSGFVRFMNSGSQLQIHLESYDDIDSTTSHIAESAITFFAVPGLEIEPASSELTYTFGIQARTQDQGPILIGDTEPNESHGGLSRNNGGYAGAPVDLDTEAAFEVIFDHTHTPMRTYYSGDFGSGYCQGLEHLVDGFTFPGEPMFQDPDDVPVHRLKIRLSGGTSADDDGMASVLSGVVTGYATCVPNPDFVDLDETDPDLG